MDSRSDPGKRTKERTGLSCNPVVGTNLPASPPLRLILFPSFYRPYGHVILHLALNTSRNSLGLLMVEVRRRRERWVWLETASGKRRDKVSSNQMGSISRGSPPRLAAESPVFTPCVRCCWFCRSNFVKLHSLSRSKKSRETNYLAFFVLREIFLVRPIIS